MSKEYGPVVMFFSMFFSVAFGVLITVASSETRGVFISVFIGCCTGAVYLSLLPGFLSKR